MEAQHWEYKVAFVEGWRRVSVEGVEHHPEHHERNSAFGRRFLNSMGADGWELAGVQHMGPGRSYMIFKRPLADGAESDFSVVTRESRGEAEPQQPAPEPPRPDGPVVSV